MGETEYKKLDPESMGNKIGSHTREDKNMRTLMKSFDVLKRQFSNETGSLKMDLPGPLSDLDITDKVNQGEITITRYGQ